MGDACSSTDASDARSPRIRCKTARHASRAAARGGVAASGISVAGAMARSAPPAVTSDNVGRERGFRIAIEIGAGGAAAIADGAANAVEPEVEDAGPDVTPDDGVDVGGALRAGA